MIKQVITYVLLSWQVGLWGGNFNNGSNDGLWYANFNNSSGANTNIGAQLSLYNKNISAQNVITLPLGKKNKNRNMGISSNLQTFLVVQANMKRKGKLFDELASINNLQLAYQNAKKGKRNYREVKLIEKNPEYYLKKIHLTLLSGNYKTSEYKIFTKNTGQKEREIYKLPFYPDRIVHHAIVQVCEPIWLNLFIKNTFANIPKRGIHAGVKAVKYDLKDIKNTQYCLKFDIKKYYPNVDHQLLINILEKKIKDVKLLKLFEEIINSAPGIPIGNYLSQWLGNVYLAYFDHYAKETLQIKYYYRFADDIVILSGDKAELWQRFNKLEKYLNNNLKLSIKGNYQVFPVNKRGIDFLGYRFYHTHTTVRKRIVKNFKHKIKNQPTTAQTQSAYWGWFKHANTHNLITKYFEKC